MDTHEYPIENDDSRNIDLSKRSGTRRTPSLRLKRRRGLRVGGITDTNQ